MNKELLNQIKKDKFYEYLKTDSYFIKQLIRRKDFYKEFKKIIKEKYRLRITDKINNAIDDIELISNIITTIN
jgi:hypothetical protein